MDVFDSPRFIAVYQTQGGSPFLNLSLPQQADLLIMLHISALSIPGHSGFDENKSWTDVDVKHLNNFLIEMVNIIVCLSYSFPIIISEFCS